MRAALLLAFLLPGCATWRDLTPQQSTATDVEAVMGKPVEIRQVSAESWLYYPKQPFGRKMFVARVAPDGKLIAVEQRLSEDYIAKVIPNQTTKEDVHDLFGPPYEFLTFPRLERETWSWYMKRFGVLPVTLNVQMSADGVVREIYVLDDYNKGSRKR